MTKLDAPETPPPGPALSPHAARTRKPSLASPPRRHDLEDSLRRLGPRLPLDRRAGVQQQLSHSGEVPPFPPLPPSLRRPDQALPLELPVPHIHRCPVPHQPPSPPPPPPPSRPTPPP